MATSTLFLGESSGGRILAVGEASAQVGTDFQLDVETWDLTPAGEVGDCLFRAIDVSGHATNGYALGVVPIVDGVELPEHTFNGSGTGEFQCQAYIATRGARIAARVRTLSRSGSVTLHNVAASFTVLRSTP